MSATRTATAAPSPAARPPRVRSRVSNGGLPGGISASSAEGRRFVDVVRDLTAQLGGQVGPAEQLQIRAIATLTLQFETMQARVLRGEQVDAEQLTRLANAAARQLNALRRSVAAPRKPAGPSALAAYLAERGAGGG